MISRLSLILGAAGGALAVFLIMQAVNALWVIPAARDAGREMERTAAIKKAVELIQQRDRTNAEIKALDGKGLCEALGGEWVADTCQ